MAVAEPPRKITLDLDKYLELLIEKDVFDPQLWPEGMRQGADLLRRIREIERQCIAEHGAFDFDEFPPRLQDEYDNARIDLDELIEPPDETPVTIQEFMAKLEREKRAR
jgi:hypothetical protein